MKNIKHLLGIFGFLLVAVFAVPNIVNAASVFDDLLTDGKLVIKSVAPKNKDEADFIIGEYVGTTYEEFWVDMETCNSTFTSCEIYYHEGQEDEESQEISILYDYNQAIKDIIDDYLSAIPQGKNSFAVKDLELINYWANVGTSIINYSGELKSYINHKNFNIDLRAGGGSPFTDSGYGVAKFIYNDTSYYINTFMGANAQYAIYVPDDTPLDKDSLMNAAQTRINNYMGPDKVTLEYVGTITEFFASMEGDIDYDYFFNEYNTPEGELYFLNNAAGNFYYRALIDGVQYYLVIIRSTEDMVTPQYKTSDVNSDITIFSTAGSIPLDTLIKVSKLTSGADYEKLIKILNITNNEMFDLKLYSGSLENFITKLADGTFEVKIPISDKFKDKDLVIYYVDEDGKTTEYEVTVKDGYAIFNTDHFSIYTLAEKTIDNPQTLDKLTSFILFGSISLIGLVSSVVYLKRKEIKG